MHTQKNRGFTIVELMISITLGLLITAAAIQLFFSGQLSYMLQKSMSDIQDNGNFGLRFISFELRKTNYGQIEDINDRVKNGGIVFTSAQTPLFPTLANLAYTASTLPLNLPKNIFSPNLIPTSQSGLITNVTQVDSDAKNVSALSSDQLVVQYFADRNGIDCEGNSYTAGRFIIQRFFLREDKVERGEVDAVQTSQPALALACEAGSYLNESTSIFRNVKNPSLFGTTNGQIILYRVDHFHYLLGVSNASNTANKRYIAVEDYKKLNEFPRPRINSIQIGMLVRSAESVGRSDLIADQQEFQVLDQRVKLKNTHAVNLKYLRQVVSQTVALRNGLNMADVAEEL